MDADELLARSLQAEEDAATPAGDRAVLLGLMEHGLFKAKSVEDPAAQAAARAVLPLERLRAEAQAAAALDRLLLAEDGGGGSGSSSAGTPAADDLLVQGMLRWFKTEFFTWVDQLPCELGCGGATTPQGYAPPTDEDRSHGAARVEAFACAACGSVTRFPRYSSPVKLLQTRRGRCGEWAHTFLLFLRVAGFDARHVGDDADHVWNEYHSAALGRWVHVDACEAAFDTPLLYEGGWRKQLRYVFGASRHGITDVTRRYVLAPAGLPARRALLPDGEAWLAASLARISRPLREALDPASRRALGLRDAAEALQLMALEDAASSGGSSSSLNLPGRQSGSEAWRAVRGETGSSSSSAAAAAGAMRYQAAGDTSLPPVFGSAGRITGGAVRASGDHPVNEIVSRLFDGRLETKWLDFGGGGTGGSAWAEYRLLPGSGGDSAPLVVTHYDLVSAEDCPERDPCDWVLEAVPAAAGSSAAAGSPGNGWVVMDTRRQQRFGQRHQLRSYVVPAAARFPSRQWRLRVVRTADPAAANSVQLAALNLYSRGAELLQRACSTAAAKQGLVYMSSDMCSQLASMARAAAAAAAAAGGGSDAGTDPALATLIRIVANQQRHPGEAKYWQLSGSSAKLQPVLDSPLLLAALMDAGFRPLLSAGGLRLVADSLDGSSAAVAAILGL